MAWWQFWKTNINQHKSMLEDAKKLRKLADELEQYVIKDKEKERVQDLIQSIDTSLEVKKEQADKYYPLVYIDNYKAQLRDRLETGDEVADYFEGRDLTKLEMDRLIEIYIKKVFSRHLMAHT